VQPDQFPAKLWVKKPGGAIRRKDRIGVSSAGSLKLVCLSGSLAVLPPNSAIAEASGLFSQLPGSAGKLSHPATVKLLKFPWATAAQRAVKSEV